MAAKELLRRRFETRAQARMPVPHQRGTGFPACASFVLLALLFAAPLVARAEEDLAGIYSGEWSGASGAAGKIRIELEKADGEWKCVVTFTLGADEVKTSMKACKVAGAKLEARYQFELQGTALESTIKGERKERTLEGGYHTVAVPAGGEVDNGSWKAAK